MKYYVTTIEQVHNGDALNEYATKSDPTTEKQARTAYFDKLSAVNKDLSDKGHTYMLIELKSSKGTVEKYTLGEYVDAEA